ncbi:MAG: hypothetical protein ACD_69C00340G0001 [uncultured bacterium]|nr:MAG: hypothetical protein ACD_69C00340G0001 [uncultured bacterium]HBC72105.1 hypothetical protein [Coxiellaceae bacterium]
MIAKEHSIFSQDCPVGHISSLVSTNIILPEGPLLSCKQCSHMVSSCTKGRYNFTMQQFNTHEGTLPNAATANRGFRLHSKRLKLIQKILKLPAENIHILDIGCSSGSFLKAARKLGFNIEGVEPAPAAAATAKNYGFKIYESVAESKNIPKDYFNALTMFEVIEHLDNPKHILKQCKNILKPGGILIIGTGNTDSWTQRFMGAKWEYYDINKHGGHISFFNPYSIKLLADDVGFKVISIGTRNVKFLEKNETINIRYRLTKILTELLNFPAQLIGKGHDMLVVLQRFSKEYEIEEC